jgi:hypothetical protein
LCILGQSWISFGTANSASSKIHNFNFFIFANIQNENEIQKKQLLQVAFAASLSTQMKYFRRSPELLLSELVHSGEELDPFWPRKFC